MAYVSIVEAVRLTGKSRSTISRYIKQGKLSKTPQGIDTAELIRVFGDLTLPEEVSNVAEEESAEESLTQYESELLAYIETLEKEVKMLQAEVKTLHLKYDEKENRLLNIIENRLTDQRKTGFLKRFFS